MKSILLRDMNLSSILKKTLLRIKSAELPLLASSMAFTTAISFIPWLAVSLSFLNLAIGSAQVVKSVEPILIEYFLPGEGLQYTKFLTASLERMQYNSIGWIGFVGLMLTSFKIFIDLDRVVLKVWQVDASTRRKRRWRFSIYAGAFLLGPFGLALMTVALGNRGLNWLQNLPKGFVGYFFLFLALFVLMRFIPDRRTRSGGALISTLLVSGSLVALEHSYKFIFKTIFKFGKMYGSLAAVPMTLVWLQIMWLIILAGVALTAAIAEAVAQPES